MSDSEFSFSPSATPLSEFTVSPLKTPAVGSQELAATIQAAKQDSPKVESADERPVPIQSDSPVPTRSSSDASKKNITAETPAAVREARNFLQASSALGFNYVRGGAVSSTAGKGPKRDDVWRLPGLEDSKKTLQKHLS